jgi:hypothetical protein
MKVAAISKVTAGKLRAESSAVVRISGDLLNRL